MINSEWSNFFQTLNINKLEEEIALLGVGLQSKSVSYGRCDLAPSFLRNNLKRISSFDIDSKTDFSNLKISDYGDMDLKFLSPDEAVIPICNKAENILNKHKFSIFVGGNNAITYPLYKKFKEKYINTALITLDAHFDLRGKEHGLINGNPIRYICDEFNNGTEIYQIGIQNFANTKYMHDYAVENKINFYTKDEVDKISIEKLLFDIIGKLEQENKKIYVDFDIDVICRSQFSSAPGARHWGLSIDQFLQATKIICSSSNVVAIDLCEYDPSLSLDDSDGLFVARWFAEVVKSFHNR